MSAKINTSERQETSDLRKLDYAIAERVIGWRWWRTTLRYSTEVRRALMPAGLQNEEWQLADGTEEVFAGEHSPFVPHYSTDIATAMEVVAWLCPTMDEYNAGRKSCRFIMRQQDSGLWSVEARSPFLTSYDTPVFADSKSLAEAICRAALALVDGPQNQEAK